MSRITYSQEIAEKICELVIEGYTLRDISSMPKMPSKGTICVWAQQNEEFKKMYEFARDCSADIFESDVIDAGRGANSENYQSKRVEIDALKWAAACRRPRRYGTRVQNEHSGNIGLHDLSDDDLNRKLAQLAATAKD